MKEKLNFEVEINASKEKVWEKMLGNEGYKLWTMAFNPGGSWYEKEQVGEFVKGEKVRFLGPDGEGKLGGMLSTVKEVRPSEFISFEHYGFIMNGVEQTDTPEIKAWAPTYENYTFTEADGITKVEVTVDVSQEWKEMMQEAWPKAVLKLKEICEN